MRETRFTRHAAERLGELPLALAGKRALAERLDVVASKLPRGKEYVVLLGGLPTVALGERNGSNCYAVIAGGSIITLYPRRETQGVRAKDVGKSRLTIDVLEGLA